MGFLVLEKPMTTYIDRLKEEHRDLKVKVTRLNAFIHSNSIFKTLCDLEQARMIKQAGFMESYLTTLDSRIWASLRS